MLLDQWWLWWTLVTRNDARVSDVLVATIQLNFNFNYQSNLKEDYTLYIYVNFTQTDYLFCIHCNAMVCSSSRTPGKLKLKHENKLFDSKFSWRFKSINVYIRINIWFTLDKRRKVLTSEKNWLNYNLKSLCYLYLQIN